MAERKLDVAEILVTPVFVRGANRRFGELTDEDVRARADELREATGWGPMARVAPVARAWRELSLEMRASGVTVVSELDPAELARIAPALWIVLPA